MSENKKTQEKQEKNDIVKREEEVLRFWQERDIFKRTEDKPAPKGEFVFYEGPPTANGKPGIHHIEARAFKDIIPRFKTMQGYHVRRKGGWDTHGLPVELQVEKDLGLTNKKDIEAYGIAEFNKKCKESVWRYVDLWKQFTERIAFWLDLEHPYITYTPSYIESLWNIVAHVHGRGLLYKDYKVVPWCPRCGTALSSHELAQGYAEVDDRSVYVKFRMTNPEKIGLSGDVFLVAWTTTPWTLPGNAALAVGEKITYVGIKDRDGVAYVFAEEALKKNNFLRFGHFFEYQEVFLTRKGSDLVGLEYEPLFPFLKEQVKGDEKEKLTNAYRVYAADFVSTDEGTGIVHTAVMYGADDFALGTEKNLPKQHLIGEDGTFLPGIGFLEGVFVKDADGRIIADLQKRRLLFQEETIRHTYPFCWRCKTPLLYFARDSWYIRMSALADELLAENEKIHWEPEYIKHGRFGEWLREVKDWAISRERYWGTPLPIWQSEGGEHVVIDSIETLKKHTKKYGNRYFVMRHGESEANVRGVISSFKNNPHPLTKKGREEAEQAAQKLKSEGIDLIITSPFVRTTETAHIVADTLGLSHEAVVADERFGEINLGELNGKSTSAYRAFTPTRESKFTKTPQGGENLADMKRRVGDLLYETEAKYENTTILFIGHEYSAWMLDTVADGGDAAYAISLRGAENDYIRTGEARPLSFVPLPHNEDYELDLHRPFIDEVALVSESGEPLSRTPEVMDVWFDSGAMPFAQDHYPFENKEWVLGDGYPADYIAEAIDQTRGWFYTLHAVGVLMGRGRAYKNVISLGHILDKEGKKMSKSVGNVVDPWEMIDRYGVDALRMWMYTVNGPGDSKNFDEKSVDEIVKKTFRILENVCSFYVLYAPPASPLEGVRPGLAASPPVLAFSRAPERNAKTGGARSAPSRGGAGGAFDPRKSPSVLDQWTLSLLDTLIIDTTKHLEEYRINEPARAIREFILDLSQWYVRRSRDRFKEDLSRAESRGGEDKEYAVATLRYVLLELSKVMAPFTPFFAEWLYGQVGGTEESVHLETWPSGGKVDEDILDTMADVRRLISVALEQRAKAGIRVRQPLAMLKVNYAGPMYATTSDESAWENLIKDEVNVKEIQWGADQPEEVWIDTTLTQDLKDEGSVRDLIRAIQDLRKRANLSPSDEAALSVDTSEAGQALFKKFEAEIKKTAHLSAITFEKTNAEPLTAGGHTFRLKLMS